MFAAGMTQCHTRISILRASLFPPRLKNLPSNDNQLNVKHWGKKEIRVIFMSVSQTPLSASWCHCDASFSSPSLSQLAAVPSILTHQIANLWRMHGFFGLVFLHISRIRENNQGYSSSMFIPGNWFRWKLLSRRPFKCNSRLAPWWLRIVILTEQNRSAQPPRLCDTLCIPSLNASLCLRMWSFSDGLLDISEHSLATSCDGLNQPALAAWCTKVSWKKGYSRLKTKQRFTNFTKV